MNTECQRSSKMSSLPSYVLVRVVQMEHRGLGAYDLSLGEAVQRGNSS